MDPRQASDPRFSWQLPLSEADRQPLHQLDPGPSPPQPQSPSRPAAAAPQSPPAVTTTSLPPLQNNRFSYVQTPVELRQPQQPQYTLARRPTEPTIPQSPATQFEGLSAISTAAPPFPDARAKDVASRERESGSLLPAEYDRAPPQEPHPALFAPIVDASPRGSTAEPRQLSSRGSRGQQSPGSIDRPHQHPRSPRGSMAQPQQQPQSPRGSIAQPQQQPQLDHQHHHRQYDAAAPPPPQQPSSPGPVPMKTESDDDVKTNHQHPIPSSPTQPFSQHQSMLAPSTRPVFSPNNPAGPNGMITELHQPGQIAHPNMDLSSPGSKHEWKHSLCECSGDVSTCMTGVFCPCVLYGKTSYRLGLRSEKKDPTDLLGWNWANSQCGLMAVASCGLCGVFPLIHRTRLRHAYHLEGSIGSDMVKACCCCCCSVIQNEREVRDREESARRWAGPASGTAYERPKPMMYEPPPPRD